MPILEVHNVSKSLGPLLKPVEILRDVNLTIEPGEFVVLSGENGAGKSTLINLILGLSTPESGMIQLMGYSPKDDQSKVRLGVFFQDSTFPRNLKVREVIQLIASCHAAPISVEAIAKKFEIQDLLDRPATKLSGGQKKWLRLVLAFIGQPELLILDEPTSDIDTSRYKAFWKHLVDFHRQGGTVLIVTHRPEDWAQLEKIATRSVQLKKVSAELAGDQLANDGRIKLQQTSNQEAEFSQIPKPEMIKQPLPKADYFEAIITHCWMEILQLFRTPISLLSTLILIGSVSQLPHNDRQAYSQFFTLISTLLLLMLCLDILGKNISLERLEKWVKFIRTTPLPLTAYLSSKIAALFTISSLSLAGMFAIAEFLDYFPSDFSAFPVVLNQLVFLVPFAAFTLCLSYLINPKGYDSVSKILFLGLAIPSALPAIQIDLPQKLETAIHFSPFYHYFQLIQEAAGIPFDNHHFLNVAWMVWFSLAFSLLAVWACQRDLESSITVKIPKLSFFNAALSSVSVGLKD